MKNQLLFNFMQPLFRKMPFRIIAFTVLMFLTVQSFFAQKWNVVAQENDISSVDCNYTSIAVVGDVPYVAYVQATGSGLGYVKKLVSGTWTQVGGTLGSTLIQYTRIFKDKTGKLYVTYIDRNTNNSYKLAVKTFDGTNWVPLITGNEYVSTGQASHGYGISAVMSDLAFDSNNVPYVTYSERNNVAELSAGSGYAYVKRFVNGVWETVGGGAISSDLFTGGNGIAFDSSDVPYVVYIKQSAFDSSTGVIKTVRFINGSWEDVSPPNPVSPGTTVSGAVNVARNTTIAIDSNDSPVIAYFNTTGSDPKGTAIRLADKITKSWTWLGNISTRDSFRTTLINDSAGNLYTIFQDALISSGKSNTVRVFKQESGTSTFNELQNIPITSPSGVGIDAAGANQTTAYSPVSTISSNAIAVGTNTSRPYIVYAKTNASGKITPIVRLFDPSTTWNGSAWSNGVPTATTEALIEGVYTTSGSGGGFTTKKLTVNSGSLTVNSGTNVTVQNQVVNNAGANGIVIENNANLIQVNNTTNTGNVVVNRNSSPLLRLDYTLWSSPVASQNLAAFSPLTSQSPSRFYTYDTATSLYSNAFNPTSTNFAAGTGYLIRMPNTADAVIPTAYAGQFTGVPNNGDISFTLSTAGSGYNLVGNPYPSTINLFTLQSNNSTVIGTTFYMWRTTNAAGTAYCTYVPTSTTAGTYVTNGNAQSPSTFVGNIQPGQGFFVKALTTGSLVFKNAQRVSTASSFFRTKQVATADKVWLNATNAAGDFSQMAVTYFDGATPGVDAFDGKYINDSPLALTSSINNEEYTIQGRPAFDVSDVVPLNFKTDVAGDYTIAIDHSEGVFAAGQSVVLADAATGTETDLTTSSYTFTATTGTANSRFSLKYQKTLATNKAVFSDNNIAVYRSKGTLHVNAGDATIANIKVYDVQGKLVTELKNVKATSASITNLKATNQVLVVKITSQENTVVTKKVVN